MAIRSGTPGATSHAKPSPFCAASGAIRVESALGKGSSFYVVFPLAQEPLAGLEERRPGVAGEPCVLVVDEGWRCPFHYGGSGEAGRPA